MMILQTYVAYDTVNFMISSGILSGHVWRLNIHILIILLTEAETLSPWKSFSQYRQSKGRT